MKFFPLILCSFCCNKVVTTLYHGCYRVNYKAKYKVVTTLLHPSNKVVISVWDVLKAAKNGKRVIRVLSDDTDMYVLYWVYRVDLELLCKVQWSGGIEPSYYINATCADLGPKCLQLLGMHVLSGCDTTSCPYGKGKISALNTLLVQDFRGLADVLGEVDTTHTQIW